MAVEAYSFGHIQIDGAKYASDVIIYPQGVQAKWWRKEGHKLHPEDLSEVLAAPPEVLVIGTGYFGRMKVPQKTLDALHAKGIETHVAPTRAAIEEFNRLQREAARIVAALHLTC